MLGVNGEHSIVISGVADGIRRSGPSEIDRRGVGVQHRPRATVVDPGRAALAERSHSPVRFIRN